MLLIRLKMISEAATQTGTVAYTFTDFSAAKGREAAISTRYTGHWTTLWSAMSDGGPLGMFLVLIKTWLMPILVDRNWMNVCTYSGCVESTCMSWRTIKPHTSTLNLTFIWCHTKSGYLSIHIVSLPLRREKNHKPLFLRLTEIVEVLSIGKT
mgnify:CR=1 FL=1